VQCGRLDIFVINFACVVRRGARADKITCAMISAYIFFQRNPQNDRRFLNRKTLVSLKPIKYYDDRSKCEGKFLGVGKKKKKKLGGLKKKKMLDVMLGK
jgi:hypothetical protein